MNKSIWALAILTSLWTVANAEGTNLIGIESNPETVFYLTKPSIWEQTAAILSGATCDFQALRDNQWNIIGAVPEYVLNAADEAGKEIVWVCS